MRVDFGFLSREYNSVGQGVAVQVASGQFAFHGLTSSGRPGDALSQVVDDFNLQILLGMDLSLGGLPLTGFVLPAKEKYPEEGGQASVSTSGPARAPWSWLQCLLLYVPVRLAHSQPPRPAGHGHPLTASELGQVLSLPLLNPRAPPVGSQGQAQGSTLALWGCFTSSQRD